MLANLEACVRDLESTVQRQQQKISDMEDRARRNNLIVFGENECVNETLQGLEDKVIKNIFSALLGINPTSVERIHILGKKRDDRDRPIILRLYDYNEKIAIFKNYRKLKGTKISIADDYSYETLQKRKLLWQSAQSDKSDGSKVRLVHDKLFINDIPYTWDAQSNCRVRMRNNVVASPGGQD